MFEDLGKAIINILRSPEMVKLYAVAIGSLAWWFFDNYIDKPLARKIAYEIAVAIEKHTEEGTAVDTFLDEFIKRFEATAGRSPSAGELKTAVDIKNKVIKLEVNKKF